MDKAFIFDMNGTMVDDMNFHVTVWDKILNSELKAQLAPARLKSEMYGTNDELLKRVFGNEHLSKEQINDISLRKEQMYQDLFRPHLELITGLPSFLAQAEKNNIPMGIGTAAIPFNIDFVVDNLNIRHYFKIIVSANDVARSKPDPELFLKAAAALNVQPENCIVFEDAPKGVEAAANAGMKAVVITTMHDEADFAAYKNILFFIKDYNDERLASLL